MPLPLVIPVLLFIGGTIGAGAGVVGAVDLHDAQQRAKAARERHDHAVARTEQARRRFVGRAERYGRRQVAAAQDVVGRFVEILSRVDQESHTRHARMLTDLELTPTQLKAYRGLAAHAIKLASGAVSAVSAGTAASSASVGLVGLLATASTGTPIIALHGAAAQSATLAWLGGGSLAAGGGGIAAGTAVLGGIVVAPALLVGGFALANAGEKAQTRVRAYEARVRRAGAELKTLRAFLARAERRVDELDEVLAALVERATAALDRIDDRPLDLRGSTDRRALQTAGVLVRAVADILRTPVLDADGELNADAATLVVRTRALL